MADPIIFPAITEVDVFPAVVEPVIELVFGETGLTGPTGPAGPGGAIGYYGSFYDTSAGVNSLVPARISVGSIVSASGITLAGSQLTIGHTGTYDIQFSVQLTNSSTQAQDATFWIKKNGADVAASSGVISVPAKHSTAIGSIVSGWNWVLDLTAGDVIDLWWFAETTDVALDTVTPPHGPVSPALILTVTQVMYTQVGPTGPQGDPGVGIWVNTTPPVDTSLLWVDTTP